MRRATATDSFGPLLYIAFMGLCLSAYLSGIIGNLAQGYIGAALLCIIPPVGILWGLGFWIELIF